MAHRHVDLGAVAAARSVERLRPRGRDVRRAFESRHHGVETSVHEQPRRGLATRLLLSIATRTDAD